MSVFGVILVGIFPAFSRIRTEYGEYSPYSVRMPENEGKMQTRITPNADTFYAVTPIDDVQEKSEKHFFLKALEVQIR